jgi:hypothetical protein
VTASSNGTIAYTNDGSELVWLGSDFQVTGSTTVALPSYASSGETQGIYSDAAGGTYVDQMSMDDIDTYESEVGFGADHQQLFRVDAYANDPTHSPIAGDPSAGLALYVTPNGDSTIALTAIDAGDSNVAWTTGYRSSMPIALATGADGTIAFAGDFESISIAAKTLIAGTLVASLDPTTGFDKWELNITGTAAAAPHIAVGPDGEIAVSLQADRAGDPVTLGGQPLGTDETFIARSTAPARCAGRSRCRSTRARSSPTAPSSTSPTATRSRRCRRPGSTGNKRSSARAPRRLWRS